MNEEQEKQLIDTGLPLRIIRNTTKFGPKTAKKLEVLQQLMESGKTVALVYGPDSPTKEIFCARLLAWYMQKKHKTGRWLTPIELTLNFGEVPVGGGVVSIIGFDLLTPQQSKIVSQIIRTWASEGRAFIISVFDQEVFTNMVGKECYTYISHMAVTASINVAEVKLSKV